MSRKAPTKARKSRQHGDAAAQAIDDDTYYVLRVILTGAPVVPFPFSKDLYLKVTSSLSSACETTALGAKGCGIHTDSLRASFAVSSR